MVVFLPHRTFLGAKCSDSCNPQSIDRSSDDTQQSTTRLQKCNFPRRRAVVVDIQHQEIKQREPFHSTKTFDALYLVSSQTFIYIFRGRSCQSLSFDSFSIFSSNSTMFEKNLICVAKMALSIQNKMSSNYLLYVIGTLE